MRANGGFLRKADFEKHTSTWVEPVSTNYRGYDVFELPPNGQGIAALQMSEHPRRVRSACPWDAIRLRRFTP